jgi:hypothetical protein
MGREREQKILPSSADARPLYLEDLTPISPGFRHQIANHKQRLLVNPEVCRAIVKKAVSYLALADMQGPTEEAIRNTCNAYAGILELGTFDSQMAALRGMLSDPRREVRLSIAGSFSGNACKEVFDGLISPTATTSVRADSQERIAMALQIIKGGAGFDKEGRVFENVNQLLSGLLDEPNSDRHQRLNYVVLAAKLDHRARARVIVRDSTAIGLSDETRDKASATLAKIITEISPNFPPLDEDEDQGTKIFKELGHILLTNSGRDNDFEYAIKTHKEELLRNAYLRTIIIHLGISDIAAMSEGHPPIHSPARSTKEMSISIIYDGLLVLGTADAQLAVLSGLDDPSEYVQKSIVRVLTSGHSDHQKHTSGHHYIHEEAFEALMAPIPADSELTLHRKRLKTMLEIIRLNPSAGFDGNGKVFERVERGLSEMLNDTSLSEDELLKYAKLATELNSRAVETTENRQKESTGLSPKVKKEAAMIIKRGILTILKQLRRVRENPEIREKICQQIARANFDSARKMAMTTLAKIASKEKEAEAVKQKEKEEREKKNTGDTSTKREEVDTGIPETAAEKLAREQEKRKKIAKAIKNIKFSMTLPTLIDVQENIADLRKLYGGKEQMPEPVRKTIREYEGFISFLSTLAFKMLPDMILEREAIIKSFEDEDAAKALKKKTDLEAREKEARQKEKAALERRKATHNQHLVYAQEVLGLEIEPDEIEPDEIEPEES